MRVHRDAPLGARTTYRVGGNAEVLVEVEDESDLAAVAELVAEESRPTLVVGKGSNLLIADAGFHGVAVVLGEGFATVEIDGTTVRAGGATALPVLARQTAAAGLRGLEWAVGVPGSVGGGVRMNAGGHGSDIAAVLLRVRVFDLATGDHGTVQAADLALGYRRSSVRAADVVVWAEFETVAGDSAEAAELVNEIVRWRRENQPGGQNAGSVFSNPVDDSAGRLVDAAGCKGLRVGSAEVSTKHANFIQADPDGSADDVLALMRKVQQRVADAFGVDLEPEVRLIGFDA